MIVWGGVTTNAQQTGGRFNPTTGLWQPTTTSGAPAARYNHMAVWAGDRMMVYGGFGSNGESIAGGASYDPVTDTWMSLPAGNPPGARHDGAIAWTGNELLIWGGGRFQSGLNQLFNTGARIVGGGIAWNPTASSNAPLARPATKSIWTGSELLIWGDRARLPSATFDNLNTGARYQPLSDSWTETSTNGAAEARNQHTAVWTGNRMIVWGGNGASSEGSKLLNNGGRYEPATDTWLPVTTNNAPSPRRNHAAVWTGNRMIVWGGENTGSPQPNGAAYDPLTDTWATLPTSAAPAARYDHAAVWTGYEMLIWGGNSSAGLASNVARYVPSAELWNARPGVQFTSPANNTLLVLPPLVTLQATATDSDGTVTNVAFYANGSLLSSTSAPPYTFDWVTPAPGVYAVTAVASDNSGLITTSAVTKVTIALPNQPPNVVLASPANHSRVVAGGFATLAANVIDDGIVAQVEFRDGLNVIGTLIAPPWTFTWNNVPLGFHALTAKATDSLGLSSTSAVVTVEAVLVPRLEVFRDPNAWRIELTGGETGRTYRLDVSTNVLDWNPWQTNTATNGSFTVPDTNLSGGQRFYRAVP